jgi:Ca-activated chloride channel family protein
VQVGAHLQADRLNRVILFTDGQANVGETRPGVIANDARGLAQRGISTTTLGFGVDYNEDLLEAMARAGDGNYYYIESPRQLASLFAAELSGLLSTVGRAVSLGLEPAKGVEILEVYNQLDRDSSGRLKLPNLIAGRPVEVALRLRVPAGFDAAGPVCRFRLSWGDPKSGTRSKLRAELTLEPMPEAEYNALPTLPQVETIVGLLQAAREKRLAAEAMERGDAAKARARLEAARKQVAALPPSEERELEVQDLDRLDAELASGDVAKTTKLTKEQIYRRNTSRGQK